jgi:phosphatidylglycerol---prolipoprotein diacylglyceryl transferase
MQPEIHIGPLDLQTFGICFALAFIAAGAVAARRLREWGKPPDWAWEMVLAALIGGVVGARLDFVLENWDEVSDDLAGNITSGSGLVWYGGAIGGAIAVTLWAWRRGMLNLGLLDLAAVPLALGYAIGRIGCQLSGDGDYGIEWDGPWAMAYPDGTVPTDETVHPTPIYETLSMGLVALFLWRWREQFRPGILFALYLIFAGLERFLVEFIRRNEEVLAGLTEAQLLSIAMVAAGSIWIARTARRGGLSRAPAAA